MRHLGIIGITGIIVAIGATMFTSLASVDGFYKADANGKAKWVNVREEKAIYVGNGTFETEDGNLWTVDYQPEYNGEYDSSYDLEAEYILVMNDNGTENYIYDDEIMEVCEN